MTTRISQKKLLAFLYSIAEKQPQGTSEIYVSRVDGSYLTMVGMEKNSIVKELLKRGITEQIQNGTGGNTANIGFNPQESKWYGWSHRAIYGFTVGSECKKGQSHYRPANKVDFIDDCTRFWDDEGRLNLSSVEGVNNDGTKGVITSWAYDSKVKNEKLRGSVSGVFTPYPTQWGKGEWVAQTIEDAKQMAIDFADGVG